MRHAPLPPSRATLAALAAMLLATAGARAEPVAPLQPMAFLAGHCWKGSFADGRGSDEHCFAWILGGKALRDTHTVRRPARPDYVGDTTYFVDPATKRVQYVYVENEGGVSRGTMTTEAGVLLFPDAVYVDADGPTIFRARWTQQGEDAYEAWSELQDEGTWKTMARLVLRRQP